MSEQLKAIILRLREQGASVAEIVAVTGLGYSEVREFLCTTLGLEGFVR